jgi:hypothetical protein
MNLLAAADILPAVEPWLPARRKRVRTATRVRKFPVPLPGGKMPALYGRQDARRYG